MVDILKGNAGNGGNGNSISGWGLKATGSIVVLVIVIVAGFAGLGAIMRDGFSSMASALKLGTEEHARIQRSYSELVCLLALPQESRVYAVQSRDVCQFVMATGPSLRR